MKRLLLLIVPLMLFALGCDSTTASKNANTTTPPPNPAGEGGLKYGSISQGAKVELNPENMEIKFVGTKKDGKHDGGFKDFTGSAMMASPSPGSKTRVSKLGTISVEIKTESLWADQPKLTAHLKTNDFFDVSKHPKASFNSDSVEVVSGKDEWEEVKITGELELHGVTKKITVPAKLWVDKGLLSLTSTFVISRKDFGMLFDESRVDDKVTVTVTIGRPKT